MLTAVLFELAPAPGDSGRRTVDGRHVHGWFLDQVARFDHDLAAAYHADKGHKPFTLWAGPRFALGPRGITRDRRDHDYYWLRLTGLDPAVGTVLAALCDQPPDVTLGRRRFRITGVFTGGNQHAWTGSARVEQLLNLWSSVTPNGRVRLRFLSPTAFAGGTRHDPDRQNITQLLPTGSLVFESLIRHWLAQWPGLEGHVDPVSVAAPDLLRLVREEAYELKTVPPVEYRRKGFIGTCEYSVGPRAPADVRRAVHVLADFAFFAGVGLKTTMGMGQVVCEAHL